MSKVSTTEAINHLSKMNKEDLIKMLEAKMKAESTGLLVKMNQSGGVFIRHDSFKEHSARTGKDYTAGINIPYFTAKALFNNPELLNQVRDSINAIK